MYESDDNAKLKLKKKLEIEIRSSFVQTIHGWLMWRKICRIDKQANYLVICIPNIQSEYCEYAFMYMDDVIISRGYEKAVVITEKSIQIDKLKEMSKRILEIIYYTKKELEDIQKFYALCNFDNRFVLATLDVPYGKDISKISHIKGFSYEDAFAYGVYRLKPYSKYIMRELQNKE